MTTNSKKHLTRIYIKDLLLPCVIGAHQLERLEKQPILINVSFWIDADKAIISDNLNDTINYKEIYLRIIHLTENTTFYLLEKLASEIADICLSFQSVQKVKVNTEKPNALRLAACSGVEIIRER